MAQKNLDGRKTEYLSVRLTANERDLLDEVSRNHKSRYRKSAVVREALLFYAANENSDESRILTAIEHEFRRLCGMLNQFITHGNHGAPANDILSLVKMIERQCSEIKKLHSGKSSKRPAIDHHRGT